MKSDCDLAAWVGVGRSWGRAYRDRLFTLWTDDDDDNVGRKGSASASLKDVTVARLEGFEAMERACM